MAQLNVQPSQEELELNPTLKEKPDTLTKIFFRKFTQNKLAVAGSIFMIFIILAAVFAPFLSPYTFEEQNLLRALEAPGKDYWLGSDRYGRDIFTRLLFGGRVSLLVAFGSVLGAVLI